MSPRWYTVLLVLAVIATSLAAFGILGIFASALVLILAGLLNGAKSVFRAILYFAAILLGIAFLLPAFCRVRESSRRMQCVNNLKQIALALHFYHDVYKCFPPAYVADKNDKPTHSWRVLILPFMEEQTLYKQYNFNEPWDGPNNRKLLTKRPYSYMCPSDKNAYAPGSTTTNYLAVVGSKTAWQLNKSANLKALESQGKLTDTILVIETGDSDIQWSEPRDLCVDNCPETETKSASTVQGSHIRDNGYFYYPTLGANAAFADGSVMFLPASMLTPDKLNNLFAVGGFNEDNGGYSLENEELQVNWYNCIALTMWVLSVVLLLSWAVRTR